MGKKTDWDSRYLRMAKLVASWSKDPDAQVGAVVVKNNRVIATGFNGFPTGVLDKAERLTDKATKLAMVVHAEENALLVAGSNARGATLYVYGKPVCARCAASIIQAGIDRVVAQPPNAVSATSSMTSTVHTKEQKGSHKIDWDELGRFALSMFAETHIVFHGVALNTKRQGPPRKHQPKKASKSNGKSRASIETTFG